MKEKGISTAVIAAVIVVVLVAAGIGAYFLVKGPERGTPPGGEEEGGEGPGGLPLYGGATYTETREILSVQGSTYTVPAHSAEVYDYYLEQMPSLGWTEVSRRGGILYFEKENCGAAIKATEDVGPQTRLVIGYASKAEFEPIEEENVLLPVDYQTIFPRSTDVFINTPPRDYFSSEILSQTHATIVGFGKRAELPDQERWLRDIINAVHNQGLKYTASQSAGTLWDAEGAYQYKPELFDATCVDIDGEKVGMGWEYGIPWHCTNNPVWREFLLEYAKRGIDCGADGIFMDIWLGSYSVVLDENGCFCEYCMQGFRGYLKERYSAEELESFGIENIDNFDYGDFIRERYLTTYRERRWEVPLFSDFLDYQMASIREFWHEYITEIRAYGLEHDKEVYVTANIPDLMAHWLPIQDELEYIYSEYTLPYPPQGRSIPDFKLARSLGMPAVISPQTAQATLLARDDLTTLMKIYTAEAYSARGFLFVPYEAPAKTLEGWQNYSADLGELSPYYDFIYNNEQCYENLFSTSKIVVLYPFSSAMWSGTDDFYQISKLLLDSHFQHDVLFAGDDGWIEDNLSLSQLNEYEVVILPNTSHLSDIQVSLLLSYAESGGNIFAFGEIGFRDENDKEVERGLLESLLVEGSHDFGLGKFIYSGDSSTKEEVGGILSGLIQPCIQTNANENVAMLEYWNNETHSIVIHLINYAYDIETEHLSPQENINLEVVLDPELLGKDLSVSYMSPDWTSIEELSYTLSDGSVEFQVPNLEFYGVVSVGEASD